MQTKARLIISYQAARPDAMYSVFRGGNVLPVTCARKQTTHFLILGTTTFIEQEQSRWKFE